MDNYDIVLDQLIKQLAKFNYAIVSCRTGAEFDIEKECLKLRFLGKDYVVSKKDCRPLGGSPDTGKEQILIIDYLLSFGGLDPGDEWVDFRDIPNSMPYDGAFRANVESVLERHVSDIIKRKEELLAKLDGHDVTEVNQADFAAIFRVFPRVECLVLLFEGDEETGAGAKLLFSSNGYKFLTTESLAAIGEALTRKLVE
ncbi:MAG: DUF3786 domain-containing protein [Firmicutes bacterium]|nr:DUF3786 domain-containing protein [Bacillota bacterium]